MKIFVGKNAGFCYGVKRAYDGAKDILERYKGDVCCLGELVHNKDVVEELKEKGLKIIENASDAQSCTIIRAHGVSRNVYSELKKKNIDIFDFTCPNVLKIHELVSEYSGNGYFTIIVGNSNHPEVIGTTGFCNENHIVIDGKRELEKWLDSIKITNYKKFFLVAQTTYNLCVFNEIAEILKDRLDNNIELKIINTICNATEVRQQEVLEMSKNVDCMIIVGGKNSSNTKKLFDISRENCSKSYLIENVNEIFEEDFKDIDKIGIMAGASTPPKSIEDIVDFLNQKYI